MHRRKPSKQGDRSTEERIPDVHAPGFVYECRRQSRLANEADAADRELADFMDQALDELLLMSDFEQRR